MGAELKDYISYKIKFARIVEALRLLINPVQWEENHKVTLFISHLNEDIFPNVIVERLRNNKNEISELSTLSETFSYFDSLHEAVQLARSIATKPEAYGKAYIATSQTKRFKTEPRIPVAQRGSNSICKYFKPNNLKSCKYGSTCKYKHINNQETLDKAKELIDKLKVITQNV